MLSQELATVATCNLCQWAMDFEGNKNRIMESIKLAKEAGATLRVGPELEIPGVGSEDHFLEVDTINHSWEVLGEILEGDLTNDIICCFGMPVEHKSVIYDCVVVALDRKVLLIRPKLILADSGNYRETRYFTPWSSIYKTEVFWLPAEIAGITGEKTTTIGCAIIESMDGKIWPEICEELWSPNSPNIIGGLGGAHIFANSSGSHHELRKLKRRVELMSNASSANGGIYVYANQQGCDGARCYYDGSAMVVQNGEVLAQGAQFSLLDVEVVTAVADLQNVTSYRGKMKSRCYCASKTDKLATIDIHYFRLCKSEFLQGVSPSQARAPLYLSQDEEIAFGPSCWMWDYLRRSGAAGFFLPLSGGADSSSTATLVWIMCTSALKQLETGNKIVEGDLCRILECSAEKLPKSPNALCSKLLVTCYMGTENSSAATRSLAKKISGELGSTHYDASVDDMITGMLKTFQGITGFTPKFEAHGGSKAEDLALQNIQARTRMVLSYMMGQVVPQLLQRKGWLLVLGTGNLDEGLRGYMTKYDCSSADINPIGGINKLALRQFLEWASEKFELPSLGEVIKATPTAELRPLGEGQLTAQADEDEMGMTYAELKCFGKLRKVYCCGPVTMFERLLSLWDHLSPHEIGVKVKRFFTYYAINRHKMTTVTPGYHAEAYGNDDNRFDLRPFLYNVKWEYQFKKIDKIIALLMKHGKKEEGKGIIPVIYN